MTTGWECPVCHKGCAPQALKCEHCAGSKLAYRPPSPDAELIGPGLWPSRTPITYERGHTDAELDRAVKCLAALGEKQLEQKAKC